MHREDLFEAIINCHSTARRKCKFHFIFNEESLFSGTYRAKIIYEFACLIQPLLSQLIAKVKSSLLTIYKTAKIRSDRCKNFLRSVRAPVLDHDRISHGPRGGLCRAAAPRRRLRHARAGHAAPCARARAITSSRPSPSLHEEDRFTWSAGNGYSAKMENDRRRKSGGGGASNPWTQESRPRPNSGS